MATQPLPPLTEEEYLAIERLACEKSEFHGGQMFAMAGGTPNHALLSANIGWLLRGNVPAGCRVFSSDLRIKITASATYTYADCTVICGEPQFDSAKKDNILNPLLIVEVLSPSTQDYDRGKKFELYRTIQSLREYLVIHQDRRFVEHHSKQDDGSWILREHSGTGGSIAIDRLGIRIALSELYATALDLD
ncbi:MAG: Uma2 family endonuclease [Bryobacteraceae bacterium]